MTTAGLDQIASEYAGKLPGVELAAHAGLDVVLGRLADHLEMSRRRAERMAQAASYLPFPAQVYAVTGGAPVPPPGIADAHAPKDGYVWFVTRLSVDGLVPGTGTAATAYGTRTSPGAAVVITGASIVPAPGEYLLSWSVDLDGTVGATDVNNFQLIGPGLIPNSPLNSLNNGAIGHYAQPVVPVSVPFGNATAIQVKSIAAGTVGAVYSAQLVLTPAPNDQVTLYRGPGLAIGAQPQNRIHTFSAAPSSPGPDWTPGGPGLLQNPQDVLLLAGAGLGGGQLVLSGDVIQVESRFVVDRIL